MLTSPPSAREVFCWKNLERFIHSWRASVGLSRMCVFMERLTTCQDRDPAAVKALPAEGEFRISAFRNWHCDRLAH